MTKISDNKSERYKKNLCKLYYRDKILKLADDGKSVREIANYLNKKCIPTSRFKGITLSPTTIHRIIKEHKQ